jgi:hypothetical protein
VDEMKRRVLASVTGMLLIAFLGASPAASAAPGSGSAGVTVTVSVAARVDYTVVDHDHIDLRSNTHWRLTLISANGATSVAGGRTGNTPVRLEIPEGTTDYFVTTE